MENIIINLKKEDKKWIASVDLGMKGALMEQGRGLIRTLVLLAKKIYKTIKDEKGKEVKTK
jgi:hypothetical protein